MPCSGSSALHGVNPNLKNMHKNIDSSGRDCVLVALFQLYGSKAGLFEGNLIWMGQYDPPTLILEEELTQY